MTNGVIEATKVVIGQPAAKPHHVEIHGTVASLQGTTLSVVVKNNAAPVQVQLTSTTQYVVKGAKPTTTAPTFTANQRVDIHATRQSDGSLLAVRVNLH